MTTEDGLLHPSRMARHIDRLRDRAEFLRDRMAARRERGEERSNGNDRAELDSLEWALPVLEAEHLAGIRLARHVLAMAGVPEDERDAQIAAGHPR